jgi:hypothetical protein
MKTINFSLYFLISIIAFSACKKNSNDNEPYIPDNGSSIPKIATITGSVDTTFFQYNSSGKLIKEINWSGYQTLEYSGNTVTLKDYSKGGVIQSTEIYTLNPRGQAISSSYTGKKKSTEGKYLSEGNFSTTYTYEYDNNGYLIREMYPISESIHDTVVYTITNGNVTQVKYPGNEYFNYTYTNSNNTIGKENEGISFLGKQNKNLGKSSTHTYQSQTSNPTTSTYEYDNKGRVKMLTTSDGSSSWSVTYTYIN